MKKVKIAFLERDRIINQKKYNNDHIGHKKYFKWVDDGNDLIKISNKCNLTF